MRVGPTGIGLNKGRVGCIILARVGCIINARVEYMMNELQIVLCGKCACLNNIDKVSDVDRRRWWSRAHRSLLSDFPGFASKSQA